MDGVEVLDPSALLASPDAWDDEALIKTYDSMLAHAKGGGGRRRPGGSPRKGGGRPATPQWREGDRCRAAWTEDGVVYDAVVDWVGGGQAQVTYTAYGNSEVLPLSALQPPAMDGTATRQPPLPQWREGDRCRAAWTEDGVVYDAVVDWVDRDSATAQVTYTAYGNSEVLPLSALQPAAPGRPPQHYAATPPQPYAAAPPPQHWHHPPSPAAHGGPRDPDESLASMLMAWYQSGYHTGCGARHAADARPLSTRTPRQVPPGTAGTARRRARMVGAAGPRCGAWQPSCGRGGEEGGCADAGAGVRPRGGRKVDLQAQRRVRHPDGLAPPPSLLRRLPQPLHCPPRRGVHAEPRPTSRQRTSGRHCAAAGTRSRGSGNRAVAKSTPASYACTQSSIPPSKASDSPSAGQFQNSPPPVRLTLTPSAREPAAAATRDTKRAIAPVPSRSSALDPPSSE